MRKFAFIAAIIALTGACKAISGILHDGEVIASVGEHKLYSSELAGIIPTGISADDSTRLVQAYIDSWTLDMLFVDLAESQLNDSEKDVSKDLETYKRALLRYRYEQKYLNQRLDTAVAQSQIEDYYNAHKKQFRLAETVVKAKFAVIPEHSSHIADLKRRMSDDADDLIVVSDTLSASYTSVYNDYGNMWIEASKIAVALGMDSEKMLRSISKGFVQSKDGKGNLQIAYISDIIRRGEDAPVAYCSDKIKEYILSSRKKDLLSGLERDLMKDVPVRQE